MQTVAPFAAISRKSLGWHDERATRARSRGKVVAAGRSAAADGGVEVGEHRPVREIETSGSVPDAGVSALRRAAPSSHRRGPYALIHEDATSVIGSLDDCMICIVHTLTSEAIDAIARTMNQLVARHGALRALSIAARKTGSEAVGEHRVAVAELVRQYTRCIRGAAVVSEGSGFRATAVRSLVTAVHIAGRASHPTKVFSTVPDALAWLATQRADVPLDVLRAEQVVTLLRRRLRDGALE
jgi:hypothetical protein